MISKINVVSGMVELKTSDPFMRSFLVPGDKGNCRVNVWHNLKNNLFTVSTHMDHPKQGRNQLYRKGLTEKEVIDLLKNPRKHTGKGYRKK